jgi:hypothetical protein
MNSSTYKAYHMVIQLAQEGMTREGIIRKLVPEFRRATVEQACDNMVRDMQYRLDVLSRPGKKWIR